MGYILYYKKENASHICPLKKNAWFQHRKKMRFQQNPDFDMQHTSQSDIIYEHMKQSQSHIGHSVLDDFF